MGTKIALKVGVLLSKDNKLLLIQERDKGDENYRWNIIKGSFDPEGDVDLVTAAKREALEEAGVTNLEITGISRMYYLPRPESGTLLINFHATTNEEVDSGKRQIENDEDIGEARFFSCEELSQLGEEDFFTHRAYLATRDWCQGTSLGIDLIKYVDRP